MYKRLVESKHNLDALRERYNRRESVHPGPLELLYRCDDLADREAAGLAAEITAGFRTIALEDPVRYHFALTRFGMRRDGDPKALLEVCGRERVDCDG